MTEWWPSEITHHEVLTSSLRQNLFPRATSRDAKRSRDDVYVSAAGSLSKPS